MNVRASQKAADEMPWGKRLNAICFVILYFRCGSTMSIWTVPGSVLRGTEGQSENPFFI